MGNTQQLGIGF